VNRADALAGNGVSLVRERALALRVQRGLERLYRLIPTADIGDFVRGADMGERETVLVREAEGGELEISIALPALGGVDGQLDTICQLIEGVSHFVYLAERARLGRAATQLELELQAEVDKWVVIAASIRPFDAGRSASLRARLYEHVAFVHGAESELGERYRLANAAAHGFVRRLEREFVRGARFSELQGELCRFFHVGQEEKLRLGRAA
jgi:hypothetical protein